MDRDLVEQRLVSAPQPVVLKVEKLYDARDEIFSIMSAIDDDVGRARALLVHEKDETQTLEKYERVGLNLIDQARELPVPDDKASKQLLTQRRREKAAKERLERLRARYEEVRADRDVVGGCIQTIEQYIERLPPGTTWELFDGAPMKVKKGASIVDAVEGEREGIAKLFGARDKLTRANISTAEAKLAHRAQVDELAARGRPSVTNLLAGRAFDLPVKVQRLGVEVGTMVDAEALVAFLHRDALVAALDREVDALANGGGIAAQERMRLLAENGDQLLTAMRREEALIEASELSGAPIMRRPEGLDARALLNLADEMPE